MLRIFTIFAISINFIYSLIDNLSAYPLLGTAPTRKCTFGSLDSAIKAFNFDYIVHDSAQVVDPQLLGCVELYSNQPYMELVGTVLQRAISDKQGIKVGFGYDLSALAVEKYDTTKFSKEFITFVNTVSKLKGSDAYNKLISLYPGATVLTLPESDIKELMTLHYALFKEAIVKTLPDFSKLSLNVQYALFVFYLNNYDEKTYNADLIAAIKSQEFQKASNLMLGDSTVTNYRRRVLCAALINSVVGSDDASPKFYSAVKLAIAVSRTKNTITDELKALVANLTQTLHSTYTNTSVYHEIQLGYATDDHQKIVNITKYTANETNAFLGLNIEDSTAAKNLDLSKLSKVFFAADNTTAYINNPLKVLLLFVQKGEVAVDFSVIDQLASQNIFVIIHELDTALTIDESYWYCYEYKEFKSFNENYAKNFLFNINKLIRFVVTPTPSFIFNEIYFKEDAPIQPYYFTVTKGINNRLMTYITSVDNLKDDFNKTQKYMIYFSATNPYPSAKNNDYVYTGTTSSIYIINNLDTSTLQVGNIVNAHRYDTERIYVSVETNTNSYLIAFNQCDPTLEKCAAGTDKVVNIPNLMFKGENDFNKNIEKSGLGGWIVAFAIIVAVLIISLILILIFTPKPSATGITTMTTLHEMSMSK